MSRASDASATGRAFIYREGRLLERRLFAVLFEGAPADGVIDVLRGYQNEDGGFGHGLEPDKRCPDSQPLDVQIALETFDATGAVDPEMARRACDFLDALGGPAAGVPPVLPSIAGYPRAEHWGDGQCTPGLNPTSAIVGLLHRFGIEHPWIERATEYCWAELSRELSSDAHTIATVLTFLEHVPDRQRAEEFIPAVTRRLPEAALFRADPDDPSYGLTPLHFAPQPDSRWRGLFDDRLIEAHLDRLQADQQPDGGWPVSWTPPGAAATIEWRGYLTLTALRVLAAYGRLSA